MAMFNNKQFVFIAGSAVLTAYFLYKKTSQVVNAVNPLNPENVINKGAESVFTEITGIEDSPAGAFYDWANGERDEWTQGRTDQIIWERKDKGQPLNPVSAMSQARQEWNDKKGGFFDKWSKKQISNPLG